MNDKLILKILSELINIENSLGLTHTYRCTVCRNFAKTISRPFEVRYDPYTQSVDILKDVKSINSILRDIQHDLGVVEEALSRKTGENLREIRRGEI